MFEPHSVLYCCTYSLTVLFKGGRIVLGGIEWQWQMVYMAHGITDQVEGPLAEFCLGPQGGQDRHWTQALTHAVNR